MYRNILLFTTRIKRLLTQWVTVKTKLRISLVVSLECAPIELKAALSRFKKSHLKLRRVRVNDRPSVSMFF